MSKYFYIIILAFASVTSISSKANAQFQSLESNQISEEEIRRSRNIRDSTSAPSSLIGGMAADMARGAAECARDPACANAGDNHQGSQQPGNTNSSTSTQGQRSASGRSCGQFGCDGVRSVQSNGQISGNPSWVITCNSGERNVVIRRGNTWTNSSGLTYSDRLWRLDVNGLARAQCSS